MGLLAFVKAVAKFVIAVAIVIEAWGKVSSEWATV